MKAPYRVLFSNDTTGCSTCKSPYNPDPNWKQDAESGRWVYDEVGFSKEILEASVDETAKVGIDAHLLQPGVGWVPWWKSRVFPFAAHVKFMKERRDIATCYFKRARNFFFAKRLAVDEKQCF